MTTILLADGSQRPNYKAVFNVWATELQTWIIILAPVKYPGHGAAVKDIKEAISRQISFYSYRSITLHHSQGTKPKGPALSLDARTRREKWLHIVIEKGEGESPEETSPGSPWSPTSSWPTVAPSLPPPMPASPVEDVDGIFTVEAWSHDKMEWDTIVFPARSDGLYNSILLFKLLATKAFAPDALIGATSTVEVADCRVWHNKGGLPRGPELADAAKITPNYWYSFALPGTEVTDFAEFVPTDHVDEIPGGWEELDEDEWTKTVLSTDTTGLGDVQ